MLKKYKSLKTEILELITSLEEVPAQGIPLGNDCYKIRLAIKSKGKGKSGGARIIICVKAVDSFVYLLTIYSKSEKTIYPTKNYRNFSKDWNESVVSLLFCHALSFFCHAEESRHLNPFCMEGIRTVDHSGKDFRFVVQSKD